MNIARRAWSKLIMRTSMAMHVAFLSGFCCMSCQVEANDVATRPLPFLLPPIQLREESRPAPTQPAQALSEQSILPTRIASPAIQSVLSDDDINRRFIRRAEIYLTRPEASASSSVGSYFDGLFKPTIIGIGKTSVSCPLVTVIKRRNPLALLWAGTR